MKGTIGEFYNIGSQKNLNNLQISKKLLSIIKNKSLKSTSKITFIKDRPGHDTRYALNSDKILKKLKWKNKTSITRGLEQTVNWYIKNIDYFKSIKKIDITKRLGLK